MAEAPDPYALSPQLTGVTPPAQDTAGRYLPTLVTAPLWRRLFAKLVDMLVSGLTTWGFTFLLEQPWASAVGLSWFVLSDWAGSPGKWLLRVRAVMLDGGRVTLLASLKRNILLGLPSFGRALIVSGVTGATGTAEQLDRGFVALFGVAVAVSETLSMWLQDDGRRWGDRFAGTRVVTR